ncbi:MAG: glycosyltransferase family 9 protein [Planctomycetaceae bacterium]|nr:glycosyltransferase family 9 protein [Planctomycetaceae bacterium]
MTTDFDKDTKVLAIHSGALGDVILFGQLLAQLQRCMGGTPMPHSRSMGETPMPHNSVTLVTGGEKGRLLKALGVVQQAIDFDALPMHEAFSDRPAEQCMLPRLLGKHEQLISCFAGGDAHAEQRLTTLTGASDAAFLPIRPPADGDEHLLDMWQRLLRELGCHGGRFLAAMPAGERQGHGGWTTAAMAPGSGGPATRYEPWPLPPAFARQARECLLKAGVDVEREYLAILPGAGSPAKCWPLERFAALARRYGMPAVFVLGPVERERWPQEQMQRLSADHAVLNDLPLSTLAGVLAGAETVIANDSGPAHLAAALGTHTVAIFGPTRPEHFAPRGRSVRVLASESIKDISIPDVLSAVQ